MKTLIKLDSRYTITKEFCGYPERRHVARFCGDWIGQAADKCDAKAMALKHRREFCERAGIDP